jgi:ribosomal protein S18 acetylase RimI-like enzyme
MEMPATNIEIVVPTPADGEHVLGLARDINLFEASDIETIQELWTEFATKGDESSWYRFLVSRQGEEILGFACYGQRPLTEGTFDLYWIGVSQGQQSRGIGKALIGEVEKRVRSQGGRLLIAETAGKEAFEPTRRFYLSAGYLLEARIRDFYKPGDDLVIFTKKL